MSTLEDEKGRQAPQLETVLAMDAALSALVLVEAWEQISPERLSKSIKPT